MEGLVQIVQPTLHCRGKGSEQTKPISCLMGLREAGSDNSEGDQWKKFRVLASPPSTKKGTIIFNVCRYGFKYNNVIQGKEY